MYTHAVGMVHSKNEAEYVVCIAKTISVSYCNAWSLSYINHHVRKKWSAMMSPLESGGSCFKGG